jgi:hypothetical protein
LRYLGRQDQPKGINPYYPSHDCDRYRNKRLPRAGLEMEIIIPFTCNALSFSPLINYSFDHLTGRGVASEKKLRLKRGSVE